MRIAFTSDMAAATAARRSRSAGSVGPVAAVGAGGLLGRGRRRRDGCRRAVSAVGCAHIDEPREPGQRREDRVVRALEELAPRGIDGLGVLEVLLEERADVAGVQVSRHS